MPRTLALGSALWSELCATLDDERETAGVISARVVDAGPGGFTYLARRVMWAPEDAYLDRQSYGLSLSSAGWVPAVRAALAEGSVPVFIHTHPRGRPAFSMRDDDVDAGITAALQRMGHAGDYVALVVAGTGQYATAAARAYPGAHASGKPATASLTSAGIPAVPIDKIRIAGDHIRVLHSRADGGPGTGHGGETGAAPQDETFDRQIRMFGPMGQRVLGALSVGVVGTGGTGSPVAEQLTRLGVGALTLIDDDVVTEPTPTRGYGMTVADIGRPKAQVLAAHLKAIGLATEVTAVTAAVQDPAALSQLAAADVVFSCVDGHGARLILNRWAYAYLTPVVDVAILVSAAPETAVVSGIDGRVTWLGPGTSCLLCRGRIDPALAYAEILEPEERKRLAGEGYAREAETRQPAVVTLTSLVASLATTELLLRLFGMADATPTELIALVQRRELRRNRIPQRPGCFCASPEFLARGAEEPLLDLMWPG
jgi:molybdopterin/thiamine biosynthesis adenylyltransferase